MTASISRFEEHAATAVAVIIPTHNRAPSLKRVLQGLAAQSYDMRRVEVIVVADGCTDETLEMLRDDQFGLRLTVIDQPQSGVAATRNHGAQVAKAPLLVFFDDDVRPAPGCLQAHVDAQKDGAIVSIGHLAADADGSPPGWWRWLEWQLEKQYKEMLDGERPVDGLALYSGNFSLPRDLFWQVDGFDTSVKACEDTDLGIRLQKTGAKFLLNIGAVGWHSGYHSYAEWRSFAYRDGQWDATEALKMAYPFGWRELLHGFEARHRFVKIATRRLLDHRRMYGLSMALLRLAASGAGVLRLRGAENFLYGGIYALIYWQAVSDGIGGAKLLWRYLNTDTALEAAA